MNNPHYEALYVRSEPQIQDTYNNSLLEHLCQEFPDLKVGESLEFNPKNIGWAKERIRHFLRDPSDTLTDLDAVTKFLILDIFLRERELERPSIMREDSADRLVWRPDYDELEKLFSYWCETRVSGHTYIEFGEQCLSSWQLYMSAIPAYGEGRDGSNRDNALIIYNTGKIEIPSSNLIQVLGRFCSEYNKWHKDKVGWIYTPDDEKYEGKCLKSMMRIHLNDLKK